MALKAARVIIETDINYLGQSVATRGCGFCVQNAGSGVAQGDSAGNAYLASSPSGLQVAGLLMNDIVNVDLTRYHLNFHKDEIQLGNRISLLRKGRVTTDQIYPGVTPTDGKIAYLEASGLFTPTISPNGGIVASPMVGRFRSSKDESGFATIDFNLPMSV